MGDVLFLRIFQLPPSFLSQVPIWSVPWSAHHNFSPKGKKHTLSYGWTELWLKWRLSGNVPMMARAVALVSFPFTPSRTSSPEPSSLQRFIVLFPELIQYKYSVSKSMERPGRHRKSWCVMACPVSSLCCHTKRSSKSLTDGAFLAGEEDTSVAAVCVGYADVVPICPVEFPERVRQRENLNHN